MSKDKVRNATISMIILEINGENDCYRSNANIALSEVRVSVNMISVNAIFPGVRPVNIIVISNVTRQVNLLLTNAYPLHER